MFFRHAGLVEPLEQELHGLVQLTLAGNVALDRLAVGQVGDLVIGLARHGVLGCVVFQMAGDGHVIRVERLGVHIVVGGLVDHFDVGFRPLPRQRQAVVARLEDVAEIRVDLLR